MQKVGLKSPGKKQGEMDFSFTVRWGKVGRLWAKNWPKSPSKLSPGPKNADSIDPDQTAQIRLLVV